MKYLRTQKQRGRFIASVIIAVISVFFVITNGWVGLAVGLVLLACLAAMFWGVFYLGVWIERGDSE